MIRRFHWLRRWILGHHGLGLFHCVEGIESDFSALERRVTELEAKLFSMRNDPVAAAPPAEEVESGSPLGPFRSAPVGPSDKPPLTYAEWAKRNPIEVPADPAPRRPATIFG